MKGGRAVGLSGIDGRMLECEPKDKALGFVGKIRKADVTPITDLLEKGYIPSYPPSAAIKRAMCTT